MSSLDADVQLFETMTKKEIFYSQPSAYSLRSFIFSDAGTFTGTAQQSTLIEYLKSEKILATVSGIIRDIRDEGVYVELNFSERTMLVIMPASLFSRLDDYFIGLNIEYRIIQDSSGIRKQEIVKQDEFGVISPTIKILRDKIRNLLDD